MTKRAAAKRATKKLPRDLSINRRREWRFDLPLRTVIEGKSPAGKKFHEETKLANISSGGAYFSLDSGVAVGSKLNLMIELPSKLTDGKKMRLMIGGITVRLEKPNLRSRKQNVAVRFSDDFRVLPASKKK